MFIYSTIALYALFLSIQEDVRRLFKAGIKR